MNIMNINLLIIFVFNYAAWAESRRVESSKCQFLSHGKGRRLPHCAIGFAAGVTGGATGRSYMVTDSSDSPAHPKPGTLRYGTELARKGGDGGVWITFAAHMEVRLADVLWVHSNTTIDGRGVDVSMTGRAVLLAGVSNVIIHNVGFSHAADEDSIHLFDWTRRVWLDHLTCANAPRGLISTIQGSTDVTVSNCLLHNLGFVMLLGGADGDVVDKAMRVTVYRNWFNSSYQRMPHCRWGYCHVANNLYTHWGYYAIGARVHAKVLSEANVFIPSRRKEVTPWSNDPKFDSSATIISFNDLLLDGATFHQFVHDLKFPPPPYVSRKSYPRLEPTKMLTHLVKGCAGALSGNRLSTCLHRH